MKTIKYISFLIIAACIISCGGTAEVNPDDLPGLKSSLAAKNQELKALEAEIDEIKSNILRLEPPTELEAVPVSILALGKKLFQRKTKIQASAKSDDFVNVSSETGGRITKLYAKENDPVRKGQLVARIDMESVQKQKAELETTLELATTVFERQKRLWDQNIGSEIQYLETKNNKERIEKSLETVNTQLRKANLYAPISGVVEIEFMKQGETASPGMPIIQILNTKKIKFVADVPENYLANISKGEEVELYIPALDRTLIEKVSVIGRTIDPANRTFKIEVATNNKNQDLKPNLLAELSFVDTEIEDVVAVPVNLVQEEVNGDKFIFIASEVENEFRAKKTKISTSESNGQEIVVTEGLTGDELIITDGYRSVTQDRKIIIPDLQIAENDE